MSPIFLDANIESTVIITTHAGHAEEYVKNDPEYSLYDAVIIVSGDGKAISIYLFYF